MRTLALVVFLFAFAMLAQGQSKDEIAEAVIASMNEKFSQHFLLGEMDVYVGEVLLVHKSGNEYRGVATMHHNGVTHDLPVEIIADGDAFLWEADQEALQLLLLQMAIEESQ